MKKPDLGRVVVGGHSFPVTALWLGQRDDQRPGINVEFTMAGPLAAFEGPITVFGRDNTGCWQGTVWKVPALAAHVRWYCCYTMTIGFISARDPIDYTVA